MINLNETDDMKIYQKKNIKIAKDKLLNQAECAKKYLNVNTEYEVQIASFWVFFFKKKKFKKNLKN
jgi:hypothetical protein